MTGRRIVSLLPSATEIVAAVNPDALPLPTEWSGEIPGTA